MKALLQKCLYNKIKRNFERPLLLLQLFQRNCF